MGDRDLGPNTNLPAPLTTFIGREKLLEDVQLLVTRGTPTCRLLTLTGAGGTGKTRVALRVAQAVADRFDDGVCLVLLASISDAKLVVTTIAQTLGVHIVGKRPPLDALKRYLRDRNLLLVLDNFEQVLGAAAEVAELLTACARLHVIVTSRAALRLSGEREIVVPPLALGEERAGRDCEAVQLFVERARAVQSDFALTEANAAPIVEICRRLDGLPLAIELAAARIRVLGPHALLQRLEHRLQFLTGAAPDLPARQQTLRSAIGWSYDLLEAHERTVFRRLAVFVGGCTLDAAESVCETEGDTVMAVESLAAKSLLQAVPTGLRETRLVMLETIREFGLEQLAWNGETQELRRKHAAYFLALAERAEPELWGPKAGGWLDRLEAEHDNFRAVLEWGLARGDEASGEVALRLAGALAWFWWMRGYFTEGRRWLGLALARPAGSSAFRTKGLYGAGFLAHIQREPAIARALLEESLVLARSTENIWAEAWVLHVLGRVAYFDEDTASARALGRQSLRLAESVGDRHLIAWAFHLLGLTEHIDAHYDLADQLYERSVAIRRGLGYVEGIAIVQCLRGMIAHRRGDNVAAQELYRESLHIDRTLGTSWRLGQTVALLAGLTVKQQPHRAARLMSAATAVFEHVQTPWVPLAEALVANDLHLARLALGEASLAAAQAQGQALSFNDALSEALTLEDPAAVIAPTDLRGLTPTEAQVLQLLAAGRTTKQIGAELYLAVSTVERHITHVYDKIGVRGKAAATAFALSHDLIQPSDVGRHERLRQG